ncbi:MAG TPA: hypothetical protein VGR50_08515 [Terriglobales bacterium]|nr:hypothetical protein [Terriglobales bacterium]
MHYGTHVIAIVVAVAVTAVAVVTVVAAMLLGLARRQVTIAPPSLLAVTPSRRTAATIIAVAIMVTEVVPRDFMAIAVPIAISIPVLIAVMVAVSVTVVMVVAIVVAVVVAVVEGQGRGWHQRYANSQRKEQFQDPIAHISSRQSAAHRLVWRALIVAAR